MKIAIIGSSGHGWTALEAPDKDLEIAGFCPGYEGEDIAELRQKLRAAGNPREYPDYRTLLEEAKPDAAVVDGRFCDHARMTVYALERGVHVYCDKPAATTLSDWQLVRQAAASGRARLFSILASRYMPWFATAKALVARGAIGKPRLFNGQKSYRLGTRPAFFHSRDTFGGLIPWVAIHSIDLILWIAGQPCREVFARHDRAENRGNGDLEMTSLCCMELGENILASVSADYYRPAAAPTHGDDRLRIVGTEGVIDVVDGVVRLTDSAGERTVDLLRPPAVFSDFLRCVREPETAPPWGSDGLYSTLVCLKARESADLRQNLTVEEPSFLS